MKIKYAQRILIGLMAMSIVGSLFISVPVSHAQSSQIWTDPVNLSNAGSSASPTIVIDASGTIHIIWIDQFEGYKYTASTDGVTWTPPKAVKFPFSPKFDSLPVLIADPNGDIHALWQNQKTNALYYSKGASDLSASSKWTSSQKLADSVIDFDAVLSSDGTLHIGYVRSLLSTDSNPIVSKTSEPTGVYYRQRKGNNWSTAQTLYASQYFRSLKREDANIHLAVSEKDGEETIHVVWDDRPQKQILWSKSVDGGNFWEGPVQLRGAQDNPGISFNVNIGTAKDKVLLLWQSGVPGGQCTQYSQWSVDGGEQFGPPEKIFDESVACPQASAFMIMDDDFWVIRLNILGDLSLVAWNGSTWSKLQTQEAITTFLNPVTLDSVIFGCQEASTSNGQLFVVGCDQGASGDVWIRSRPLGTIEDWFPPAMTWSAPVKLTDVDEYISNLVSVSDEKNNIHALWSQTQSVDGNEGTATIQYERWNGESLSGPVTIVSSLTGEPVQLTAKADNRNRLLLSWVDAKTGDISFGWTDLDRASISSSWEISQSIPSVSQANSAPYIVVDDSGLIIVAYAVPMNESRGIYFVESGDNGSTWTEPIQVFDAVSAGWDSVDQPNLSLTGDGRLHILFRRYSLRGGSRQSLGLYYSQSANGGITWSNPEEVSRHAILWSGMVGYDRSILHRSWQEYEQSMFVSFHQISQDSGQTWSTPIIVSNIDADTTLNTQTLDKAGNLHFLQLASKENLTLLRQWIWDTSYWNSQAPKELYIQGAGSPSSIIAEASSGGNLLLSILVNDSQDGNELRSSIISLNETLVLPRAYQTPYPAILPAVAPRAAMTEDIATSVSTPTQISPVALNDSQSSSTKNLVGFLLLGGILVLIGLGFQSLSPKRKSSKATTR